MLRRLPLSFFALALAGCPSSSSGGDAGAPDSSVPTCTVGILGDPAGAPDFQITAPGPTADVVLADGNDVALALPPQGGRVIFAGVRATNVDGCALQISGAVRDLSTQQVRVDSRTVNLVRGSDGVWGTSGIPGTPPNSQLANYSNIPVCPNEWASSDLFDHTYQLEMTIRDRRGKELTKTVKVIPRCSEPSEAAECACICKVGYMLGEPCALDGGTDADAGGDQ